MVGLPIESWVVQPPPRFALFQWLERVVNDFAPAGHKGSLFVGQEAHAHEATLFPKEIFQVDKRAATGGIIEQNKSDIVVKGDCNDQCFSLSDERLVISHIDEVETNGCARPLVRAIDEYVHGEKRRTEDECPPSGFSRL